jgi:hypothetical protein
MKPNEAVCFWSWYWVVFFISFASYTTENHWEGEMLKRTDAMGFYKDGHCHYTWWGLRVYIIILQEQVRASVQSRPATTFDHRSHNCPYANDPYNFVNGANVGGGGGFAFGEAASSREQIMEMVLKANVGQNFVEFLFQLRVFQVKFMILASCACACTCGRGFEVFLFKE